MTTTYPRIEKMMAGYINMDAYEIAGSSNLSDQVAYYTTRVSPKALRALLLELNDFERMHRQNLTDDFENEFDYGANITDAKAFFDLVRTKVNSILDEKSTAEAVGKQTSISGGSFVGSITRRVLERLAGSFDSQILKAPQQPTNLNDTGYVGEIFRVFQTDFDKSLPTNTFWSKYPTVEDIPHQNSYWIKKVDLHDTCNILPQYAALSQYLELRLLKAVQSTPDHMRFTEEYILLLQKLLELKGVDVKSDERDMLSNSLNTSIEDFLQQQEMKTSR